MPITRTTIQLFQQHLHTPAGVAKLQAELKSIIYIDEDGQLSVERVH